MYKMNRVILGVPPAFSARPVTNPVRSCAPRATATGCSVIANALPVSLASIATCLVRTTRGDRIVQRCALAQRNSLPGVIRM